MEKINRESWAPDIAQIIEIIKASFECYQETRENVDWHIRDIKISSISSIERYHCLSWKIR